MVTGVEIGVSAIRRLGVARKPVEVVLVGSVWRTDDVGFHERVRAGLLAAAPRARLQRVEAPPALGAALLGADRLHRGEAAEARLRSELTLARLARAGPDQEGAG